ncbi:hypothetical protein BJX99DRAFT_265885 [Aspergillus californicus]
MTPWIKKLFRLVKRSKLKQRNDSDLPSSHEEPPWSLLLELPLDILVIIVPLLPLVSQACLALTCKPLYRLFCSAHDDEQLAWPRFLATPFPHKYLSGSQVHLPRIDLLLKLEDARWLYCSGCLKLHPINHFNVFEINHLPIDRYCENRVGVVDLCACVALTYTNGVLLADWIQTGVPSSRLHKRIRQEFQFRVIKDRPVLIHNCSVTSQPDAFVTLKMMVALDSDNCLIVTTRYNVYWSTPHNYFAKTAGREPYRTPNDTEAVFLCPHIHALAWLYGPYAPYRQHKNKCANPCDTKFRLLGRTVDGFHAIIWCERNLGIIQNDPFKILEFDLYPFGGNVVKSNLRRWYYTSRSPGNPTEKHWY